MRPFRVDTLPTDATCSWLGVQFTRAVAQSRRPVSGERAPRLFVLPRAVSDVSRAVQSDGIALLEK